jgi:DNA-binding response OmpR family regulator
LLARIRYHLKNKTPANVPDDNYSIGQYTFNSKTFRLSHPVIDEVKLTHSQGVILQQLCTHSGKTVSREALMEALWGKKTDMETRSVDTHISSLRKYLKDDTSIEIRKCYGQGYQLVVG